MRERSARARGPSPICRAGDAGVGGAVSPGHAVFGFERVGEIQELVFFAFEHFGADGLLVRGSVARILGGSHIALTRAGYSRFVL